MAIQSRGASLPRRRDGVSQEPTLKRTAPLLQSRKDRVLSKERHRPADLHASSLLEAQITLI